eukprot:TRINITY_DN73358_c0_g1_i1.p1 TRINITY_DN73358_c0_g1~~TRINITY_DN73358_c0_g1_i1.p1  ORF type:complete len:430 (-),score=76.22 TRINITY_DN73358_c0_g1_i1:398-1687(-)
MVLHESFLRCSKSCWRSQERQRRRADVSSLAGLPRAASSAVLLGPLLRTRGPAMIFVQRTPAAPQLATSMQSTGQVLTGLERQNSRCSHRMVLAGFAVMVAAGVGSSLSAGSCRRSRRERMTARRQAPMNIASAKAGDADELPADFYELLGVSPNADKQTIKNRYHDLQKMCHPDVVGEDGAEVCILLNDAWDLLSDDEEREKYNGQIQLARKSEIVTWDKPICTDLSPTWAGKRKTIMHHSEYTGIPLSASKWAKVKEEDAGEKWAAQKFLYVDEWNCVCCRNCCDIAPQSFCIQADNGRANVYTQWGNSEEYLDYAVASCPTECIHWVSREELQALEYVTAERMVDEKLALPCPMSFRQDVNLNPPHDPWADAAKLNAKIRRQQAQASERGAAFSAVRQWFSRIKQIFDDLPMPLRGAVFQKRPDKL